MEEYIQKVRVAFVDTSMLSDVRLWILDAILEGFMPS